MVIVKGRKPVWAFEVKVGEFGESEAREAVKRMGRVAKKVELVSLRERPPEYGDLSLGPKELVEIAQELFRAGQGEGS